MNRLRDKRSILFLAATALLSIAFALTLAHSFEHEHDEEHASECHLCLWATSLFVTGLLFSLTNRSAERYTRQHSIEARLTPFGLLHSGRAPPTQQKHDAPSMTDADAGSFWR